MKLLEVAPDFVRSEVGTLMTILQMLQNKVEPGAKVPTQNLVNLMNNAGYPFNWRAIEGLKEKYPAIAELISNADEDYITIGGEQEPEMPPPEEPDFNAEPEGGPEIPSNEVPNEPTSSDVNINGGRNPERQTVDKMAARAARF